MAGAKRPLTAADHCCAQTARKRLREAKASGDSSEIEFAQLVLDHANEEVRVRDAEREKLADEARRVAGAFDDDDSSSEAEDARAAARAAFYKTERGRKARTEARLVEAAADAQAKAAAYGALTTRAARNARKRAAEALSRTGPGRFAKSARAREDAAAARRAEADTFDADDESSEAEDARASASAAERATDKAVSAALKARRDGRAQQLRQIADKFAATVNTRAAQTARAAADAAERVTVAGQWRAPDVAGRRREREASLRATADALREHARECRAFADDVDSSSDDDDEAELARASADHAEADADAAERATRAGRQRKWRAALDAIAADLALKAADFESDDASSEAEDARVAADAAECATHAGRMRERRAADHRDAVLAHAAMTGQDPTTVAADGCALGRAVADWCAAGVAEGRDRDVESRVYVGNCAEWRRKGHAELRDGLKRKWCAAKGPGGKPLPLKRLTVRYWGPYEAKAKVNLGEVVAHYHTAAELGVEVVVHEKAGIGGLSHKRGASYLFAWIAEVLPGDEHRDSRFVVARDGASFSANLEAELAAASATEPMPALASDGDVDFKLRKRGGGRYPGTYHVYTRGRWFVREWTKSGSPREYERARCRPSADVARAEARKLVAQKTAEDYKRGVYVVVA